MAKNKIKEIVLVKNSDPSLGVKSVFKDIPVLRGPLLFMREGLYDEKKYLGIPVDRSRCK